MFLIRSILIVFSLFLSAQTSAQIRFYFQYRGIPLYQAGMVDFSVLSGIKVDPNKEVVVGLGLTGTFKPLELDGKVAFNKNTFSLGFNYYVSRKFYIGTDAALSQLRSSIRNSTTAETITGKFFFDYQFKLNYVVLLRLHFGASTGIMDFTKLAVRTAGGDRAQKVTPNFALSLRVYVFQIKI